MRFPRRRLTQVLLALIGLLPITYPLAQGQGEDVVATQSPASSATGAPVPAAKPPVASPSAEAPPVQEEQAAGSAQAQTEARAEQPAPVAGATTGTRPTPTTPTTTAPAPAPAAPKPATAPTSPTAAPAPVAPAATNASGPLSWAPPSGWENYPVHRITSTTSVTTVGARGGDVRIELDPSRPVAPITIANCRNAVIMGGQINVLPTARIGTDDQRAIYVHKCTGTVHIEGVLINGNVNGSQADGIAVNAPEATVQIQNVRMEALRGTYSVNHADVFQPWGGVKEYRIDRLSGTTNYQGIQVRQDLGAIGKGTIRNANVGSSGVTPIERGGQFIRIDCNTYPLALENVYIDPRSGRDMGYSVWPQTDDRGCPAKISNGVVSWPSIGNLSGTLRQGKPASGDFVPAGTVGRGYVSPGYR
ncbi:hypothetical protein [Blastococcus sp. VKM Ac-2987]|uniref:hypothetical protein n=1 Tax=Blastococcus sp. VKM Ac-2987 TaxID=3004141 RepID=UPI0022AB53E4|nr:hypothetical protein [Blastococcus sp. VKM Ac-2987]MCZ2858453.1 hypothetical protein [Blastococcus sp. VKM Ac-2987]